MRSHSRAVSNNGYSDVLLERKNVCARFDKLMSDQEIRDFARLVIRSSGGQCDSFVLYSELSIVGVTTDQFQSAIKKDYEIEVSKGLARLIEK